MNIVFTVAVFALMLVTLWAMYVVFWMAERSQDRYRDRLPEPYDHELEDEEAA
jgi:hypothetical protein